jgi:hypothetical protein
VLVALGAITLMTYGSALAQQAPPQAPAPPAVSPAAPPAAPSAAQGQAQTQKASGELVSVDAKASTLTVKTSTAEIDFKYDDSTKVTGASKGTAGLATMAGAQVVISYKKDGATNMATDIEVKPAASPRP